MIVVIYCDSCWKFKGLCKLIHIYKQIFEKNSFTLINLIAYISFKISLEFVTN